MREPSRRTLYARFEVLERTSGRPVAHRKGRVRADITGHTEVRYSESGMLVINGDVVIVDQPRHGWPDSPDLGAVAMGDALQVMLGDQAIYNFVGVHRASSQSRLIGATYHSASYGRRLCFRVDVASGLVESVNIEDSTTAIEVRLVEHEYVDWLARPTLESLTGDGTPSVRSDLGP